MSEPVLSQTIMVDGFTAYDYVDPPADTDGNTFIWQTIEGWFGGVAPRGNWMTLPIGVKA